MSYYYNEIIKELTNIREHFPKNVYIKECTLEIETIALQFLDWENNSMHGSCDFDDKIDDLWSWIENESPEEWDTNKYNEVYYSCADIRPLFENWREELRDEFTNTENDYML